MNEKSLDGEEGRFPMVPVQGVVAVLLSRSGGSVLMEHRPEMARWQGGEWLLPGGRLEPGEAPAAALRREMDEELGINVHGVDPLPLVDTRHAAEPFLMQPFHVRAWGGEIPPYCLDRPEARLRWVPLAEALASPVRAVRCILAGLPPDQPPLPS